MKLCGRGKGGDNGSWWILNALKEKMLSPMFDFANVGDSLFFCYYLYRVYFIPGMPVCGLT